MTTRRMAIGAAVVLVALLAAFLLGYWPERQRRAGAEREAADLHARADTLEGEVRAARLLGDLLHVTDAAAAMNYGVAQELSSAFFDAAREEADRAPDPAVRATLRDLVGRRDAITSALARGDVRVVETLRQMKVDYREALGYPTGFRTPAASLPEQPVR